MANDQGAVMGGKWVNDLVRDVVEELDDIAGELLDVLFVDKYPGGVEPVTLSGLKKMPITKAIGTVEQLEQDPYTQADAAKLGADYSAYLLGLGSETVARMIEQELAAAMAAQAPPQPVV